MKKNYSKFYPQDSNAFYKYIQKTLEEVIDDFLQTQKDYILSMIDIRSKGVSEKEDIREQLLSLAGEFVLKEINENKEWEENGVLNGRSTLVDVDESYKQVRDHQAEEFVKNRDSFKLTEMEKEEQIKRDQIHEKMFKKFDGVLNGFKSVRRTFVPETFEIDDTKKFEDCVTYDPNTNRFRKNGKFVSPVNTNVKVKAEDFRKYLEDYNKKNMYETPNVKDFNNSQFDKKVNRFRGNDGKFLTYSHY